MGASGLNSAQEIWRSLKLPLVAILRGIRPVETSAIVTVLLETGFRAIEIPLNSPDPYQSISIAVKTAQKLYPEQCLIGAGTVCQLEEVDKINSIGANLIVSTN